MVGPRTAGLLTALLVTSLLIATPASAQEPMYLLLGEDATGDGTLLGEAPSLDTWVDINGLSVATVGEDLLFHMGLEGTTTEIGSYCWMAAFEYGGTEYVGLDCFEGIAYESDNTLSSVNPPSTSRGTNVASDVSFTDTGVLITIPLSAFGASVGDMIDDIYGLTYFTRALTVVDTIPDAKSSAAAEESLGSYRIGGPVDDAPVGPTVQKIFENLTVPSFLHEFANATSDDYTLNFTVPWQNVTIAQTAQISAGSANITVLREGVEILSLVLDNQTAPVQGDAQNNGTADSNATAAPATVYPDAAGNWSIVIDYEGFVGTLGMEMLEYLPMPTQDDNVTDGPDASGDVSEDAPGVALPLLGLGLLAAVFVVRRRN